MIQRFITILVNLVMDNAKNALGLILINVDNYVNQQGDYVHIVIINQDHVIIVFMVDSFWLLLMNVLLNALLKSIIFY